MANEAKGMIDALNKSYQLGGMPLTLVSAGFGISSVGSVVEASIDIIPGVDPKLVFLVGALCVFFGGFMWIAQAKLKQQLQLSMLSLTGSLIEGAGNAAIDGLHFKTALESSLPELPKVFETIKKANEQ